MRLRRGGGSKVSQILGSTTTLASLDTFEGSQKCQECPNGLNEEMAEWRLMRGAEKRGGGSIKSVKSFLNIGNYHYFSLFVHF